MLTYKSIVLLFEKYKQYKFCDLYYFLLKNKLGLDARLNINRPLQIYKTQRLPVGCDNFDQAKYDE